MGCYTNSIKIKAAQAAKVGLTSLAKADCCKMKRLLAPACGSKSAGLMAKKQQRFCIHVGEYRHRKLKGLVITNTYCCFKSRIAKEIQEQTRKGNKNTNMQPMLNRSFGDARNPDCEGLSFEEMQKVNWEKIDFDFLGEEIEKSSLWKKMGDITKAMEHTENIMTDEINAIKSDFADKTNNKTDEVEIDDMKSCQEKWMKSMMNLLNKRSQIVGINPEISKMKIAKELGFIMEKYNRNSIIREAIEDYVGKKKKSQWSPYIKNFKGIKGIEDWEGFEADRENVKEPREDIFGE